MSGDQIEFYAAKHPSIPNLKVTYGTAGFRMHADSLDYVNYTVGILAALRSKLLAGQTVGVMVTASHNPPQDNGVKVVDPLGSMLESLWEKYATDLANASPTLLPRLVSQLCSDLHIDFNAPARICIGHDSRALSPALAQATIDGVLSVPSSTVDDIGLCSTPQLHYMTRTANDPPFGVPSEQGYFAKMANAFFDIIKVSTPLNGKDRITIDCANGVGALLMESFISTHLAERLSIHLVNSNYTDPQSLNHQCGADFVKTQQCLPQGVVPDANTALFLFDGDADRLMCYYTDPADSKFVLLDGDKMATLLAAFFARLLEKLPNLQDLSTGVVQTAYANGALTEFIRNKLKLPVVCTPTGVKHLHHAATDFDIGVYFEANGHGTVVFSQAAEKRIFEHVPKSDHEVEAISVLRSFTRLINQTVGDAVADLLAVLAALRYLGRSMHEWAQDYNDLPNRLIKVVVPDRSAFTTTNAERTLVTPAGLQQQIDALVSQYPAGRSFVRASGTEDAVRVYAEADTQEHAQELADKVGRLVENQS